MVRIKKGVMVTAKRYTNACLKELREAIEKQRLKSALRGIKLQHDNVQFTRGRLYNNFI